jgi:hypothetical protein
MTLSPISLSHWHYLIITIYLNGFLSCKIETSIAASEKEKISKFTATQRNIVSMRGRQEEDTITRGTQTWRNFCLTWPSAHNPSSVLIQNLNFTAISSVTTKPTKP